MADGTGGGGNYGDPESQEKGGGHVSSVRCALAVASGAEWWAQIVAGSLRLLGCGTAGFAVWWGVRSFSRSSDNPSNRHAEPKAASQPASGAASNVSARPRLASERPREIPVCGLAAVQALFRNRSAAIKRLFFDAPTGRRVGGISGYMAGQRKVYRQVEAEELEKIAGTVHHGGIVAIIDQPVLGEPTATDLAAWARLAKPVVVLDRIGNAHNLGAIVRTLAFFGVEHLVVASGEAAARPGESAYRVAEGGMEHVAVWVAADLARLCGDLRNAGFAVVGTDVRGPGLRALSRAEFLATSGRGRGEPARERPIALVLGNEEAGLAPEVAKACERLVRIPGAGRMESLNVSAAAAVLVGALMVGH
jgi:TrmH RNA methyltransferase